MTIVAKIPLPDVATVVMGQSPPGSTYNERGEGLPFFQGKAEFGDVSPTPKKWCTAPQRIAEAGDILMSVRAPVGPINLASEQCCIGRGLAAIRADAAQVDSTYLRFFLRHVEPRLANMGQGSTFAAIGRAEIASLRIPLPPLAEQRRIVDLLSRAEGIVRLRREAQAKAQAIIPALFLDMFGDPATNPKGWPVLPLGELLSAIDSGTSPKCHSREREGDEWGVLRLGAVTYCEYDESEHKALPVGVEPNPSIEVVAGDLLFSRKNTPGLVGASAYVWATAGRLLLPDLIFRLRIANLTQTDPVYLWKLLTSKPKRQVLTQFATGSAGSMPNISKARLRTLPVELPPYESQAQFSERVRQLQSIVIQQIEALKKAEATFHALLARAFSNDCYE